MPGWTCEFEETIDNRTGACVSTRTADMFDKRLPLAAKASMVKHLYVVTETDVAALFLIAVGLILVVYLWGRGRERP